MANELQTKLDAILEDKNTNLLPENLKAGVTCLGVEGTMTSGIDTSDATAVASDLVEGKTAYVNGEKIEGVVQERTADTVSTFATNEVVDASNSGVVYAKTTSYDIPVLFRANTPIDVEIPNDKLVTAIGLTANKLVEGNTILGVTGTAEITVEGGTTQLKYDIDTPLETPEGVTYPFTLSGNYYQSTNQGKDSSFSYGKLWFWSDGVNPLVFEAQSYGESSLDHGIISTYDHDLTLSNSRDTNNVFYTFSSNNNTSITLTYSGIPAGLHYITFKFRKDGSTSSGNDCMRIQASAFPEIHKVINVYCVESTDELSSLQASTGDLCAVYDTQGLLYKYDGASWFSISVPSNMIARFTSIEEMDANPGLADQTCVVYGNDFGNYTAPTETVTTSIALRQSFDKPSNDDDLSWSEITSMTDSNGLQHKIYAYGDEDWDWDDKPAPSKNEIIYMTYNTSTYEYIEIARWKSEDGTYYTTDDFKDALIIENVSIGTSTLSTKSYMIMSLVPAFFGMFKYGNAADGRYYTGWKNWTTGHTETQENRKIGDVLRLGGPVLQELVLADRSSTTSMNPIIIESSTNIYDLYYDGQKELNGELVVQGGQPRLCMLDDSGIKITASYYATVTETSNADWDNPIFYHVKVNLNTSEVTSEKLSKTGTVSINSLPVPYVTEIPTSTWITSAYIQLDKIDRTTRYSTSIKKMYDSSSWSTYKEYTISVPTVTGWHYGDTQFSDILPSDLYTNIYAYGKYGPVTGDGSWMNNITDVQQLQMYYGEDDVLVDGTTSLVKSGKNSQCIISTDVSDLERKARYVTIDDVLVENKHVLITFDAEHRGFATPNENYILELIEDKTNVCYTINIKNPNGEILFTKSITTTAGTSDMYYDLQITENYAWITMYTASSTYTVVRVEYATGEFATTTVATSGYSWASWISIATDVEYDAAYFDYCSTSGETHRLYVVSYNNGILTAKQLVNKTYTDGYSVDAGIAFSADGQYITVWCDASKYESSMSRTNYDFDYYKITRSTKTIYTSGSVNDAAECSIVSSSGSTYYTNRLYSEDTNYWYIGNSVYTKKGVYVYETDGITKPDLPASASVDLQYYMTYSRLEDSDRVNQSFIIRDLVNNTTKNYIGNLSPIVISNGNTIKGSSSSIYFLKYTDEYALITMVNGYGGYILGKVSTYTVSDMLNCEAMCLPSATYTGDSFTSYTCRQYTFVDKRVKNQYENTISPAEYEEINTIAEDVLGGVE